MNIQNKEQLPFREVAFNNGYPQNLIENITEKKV